MKFIFIGGVNIPSVGGIESYVLNLAKHLKLKGHDCIIICRGEEKGRYQVDGIEIVKEKVSENQLAILVHNIKASLTVWRYFRNYDVVNYQSIYFPFLYEWIPKLRGIKVIHTQHSFAQDNPKHGKISRIIISAIYSISALMFSPITTVSEQNRKLIRKRMWKDAEVINCGVELPKDEEQSNIFSRLGINKGKYYLTIGRIDPVKNLDVLIKAFLRHPKGDDVQLIIAGNADNNYGERLREMAKNDNRIIFTGPVFGSDKNSLLKNCMAYGLVSQSEGFPIALLEAMSFGKVCICSDIPSNKETLTEALGLWCRVNDDSSLYETMKEYENHPEKYQHLGKIILERIESKLTWDKIADQYVEFVHSLGIS